MKDISFKFPTGREVIFGATMASMIGDGVTELVLGTDQAGEVSVHLSNGQTGTSSKFAPDDTDQGEVKLEFGELIVEAGLKAQVGGVDLLCLWCGTAHCF